MPLSDGDEDTLLISRMGGKEGRRSGIQNVLAGATITNNTENDGSVFMMVPYSACDADQKEGKNLFPFPPPLHILTSFQSLCHPFLSRQAETVLEARE